MAKQVVVLARYIHKDCETGKPNGTVSYLVRSSNEKDTYCTTIVNGHASGCSCPSRKPCYHMTQLEQKEQERNAVANQFKAQVVPTWTMQLVNTGKLTAPIAKVTKPVVSSTVTANNKSAKVTDISMKGNLNTSRAFSLMR